jgi:hypothetical protein
VSGIAFNDTSVINRLIMHQSEDSFKLNREIEQFQEPEMSHVENLIAETNKIRKMLE